MEIVRGRAGRLMVDYCLNSHCFDRRAQLYKIFEVLHVVNITDLTPKNNNQFLLSAALSFSLTPRPRFVGSQKLFLRHGLIM